MASKLTVVRTLRPLGKEKPNAFTQSERYTRNMAAEIFSTDITELASRGNNFITYAN